eukprot:scaffold3296_cov159-Ochromonas_danica.AAC.21
MVVEEKVVVDGPHSQAESPPRLRPCASNLIAIGDAQGGRAVAKEISYDNRTSHAQHPPSAPFPAAIASAVVIIGDWKQEGTHKVKERALQSL